MTTATTADVLEIICPQCDTPNRVPVTKLAAGGKCGRCKQPLFTGTPVALSEARFAQHLRNGIPLVVDFWAPWCGPCRAFAPVYEQTARTLEPRVRLAKVNTEEAPNLSAQLQIRSIPTLAIFRQGREIARISGALPAAQFQQWVLSHT